MYDIDAQYAPLDELYAKLKPARKAYITAVDALNAQMAVTQAAQQRYDTLHAKTIPYAGGTFNDMIAAGQAGNALEAEQEKLPALQSAVSSAISEFNGLWSKGKLLYDGLLAIVGAVEQV